MKENFILEALRCGRVLSIVVGAIVVLSTDKPLSHVREQRNKSGQVVACSGPISQGHVFHRQ